MTICQRRVLDREVLTGEGGWPTVETVVNFLSPPATITFSPSCLQPGPISLIIRSVLRDSCVLPTAHHQPHSPAAQILTYGLGKAYQTAGGEKKVLLAQQKLDHIKSLPLNRPPIHLTTLCQYGAGTISNISMTFCLNTIWHVRKYPKILAQGRA